MSDLASWIDSKVLTPVFATDHPLRPTPLCTHPATPFAQGTEKTRFGTCAFPETVIARRSGKPSRLASPSLRGMGKDGVKVVSCTSSEGVSGNREDTENLKNAYIEEDYVNDC